MKHLLKIILSFVAVVSFATLAHAEILSQRSVRLPVDLTTAQELPFANGGFGLPWQVVIYVPELADHTRLDFGQVPAVSTAFTNTQIHLQNLLADGETRVEGLFDITLYQHGNTFEEVVIARIKGYQFKSFATKKLE